MPVIVAMVRIKLDTHSCHFVLHFVYIFFLQLFYSSSEKNFGRLQDMVRTGNT